MEQKKRKYFEDQGITLDVFPLTTWWAREEESTPAVFRHLFDVFFSWFFSFTSILVNSHHDHSICSSFCGN
jgi:hypothetical protein